MRTLFFLLLSTLTLPAPSQANVFFAPLPENLRQVLHSIIYDYIRPVDFASYRKLDEMIGSTDPDSGLYWTHNSHSGHLKIYLRPGYGMTDPVEGTIGLPLGYYSYQGLIEFLKKDQDEFVQKQMAAGKAQGETLDENSLRAGYIFSTQLLELTDPQLVQKEHEAVWKIWVAMNLMHELTHVRQGENSGLQDMIPEEVHHLNGEGGLAVQFDQTEIEAYTYQLNYLKNLKTYLQKKVLMRIKAKAIHDKIQHWQSTPAAELVAMQVRFTNEMLDPVQTALDANRGKKDGVDPTATASYLKKDQPGVPSNHGYYTPASIPERATGLANAARATFLLDGDCAIFATSKSGYAVTALHCLKKCVEAVGAGVDREHHDPVPYETLQVTHHRPHRRCPNIAIQNLSNSSPMVEYFGGGEAENFNDTDAAKLPLNTFAKLEDDFAVLQFDQPFSACIPAAPRAPMLEHSRVFTWGYPAETERGDASSDGKSEYMSSGSIVPMQNALANDFYREIGMTPTALNLMGKYFSDANFHFSDMDTSGGNSGGPVLNDGGQIVGIHTKGLVDEDHIKSKYYRWTSIELSLDHIRASILKHGGSQAELKKIFDCKSVEEEANRQ